MEEIPILLLAPNWRFPLVRSFSRARDSLGLKGKLICADSDSFSSSLKAGDRSCIIPLFPDPDCLPRLMELCRSEAVKAVLPFTDKAIDFLDNNRESFDAERIRLLIPPSSAIQVCRDKKTMHSFLVRHDVPTPEIFESCPDSDAFPLFAKKRYGEGGEDVFMIRDEDDWNHIARKFPEHIFQRYIRGREFSMDWFGGNGYCFSAQRERLQVRSGEARVTRLQADSILLEKANSLASILKLSGPACIQGILGADKEFYFTDINLRFGSGVLHTIMAGGNIPEMIYRELAGLKQSVRKIKDGSVMTRYTDGFLLEEN